VNVGLFEVSGEVGFQYSLALGLRRAVQTQPTTLVGRLCTGILAVSTMTINGMLLCNDNTHFSE
jgi:hypothetical protein